jgi:hypothetical protein
MRTNPSHVWQLIPLFQARNKAIAGVPGAPLDPETWLRRHARSWPFAFAYGRRSTCQPAVRKIHLAKGAGER